MSKTDSSKRGFRQFFFRGLGIVLPTILTIWILVAVYQFVDQKIADPINRWTRWAVVRTTHWPVASDDDFALVADRLVSGQIENDEVAGRWRRYRNALAERADGGLSPEALDTAADRFAREEVPHLARQHRLGVMWNRVRLGDWAVLDLIGLVVAVLLIFIIGRLAGGYIGHRLYAWGEGWLRRVPGFKQVYPYVKQVTDFFVGDERERLQFNQVVAVQYPRRGIWSVGLVTGDTLRRVQDAAGTECMTIFIPSSPTPFTGYVITVPLSDVIELPITIDEALRFCVSGGVIVPEGQVIQRDAAGAVTTEPANAAHADASGESSGPPAASQSSSRNRDDDADSQSAADSPMR